MTTSPDAPESTGVTDDRGQNRYELVVEGETAIAAYDLEGDVIAFTHTAVPPALTGKGVASRLIAGAMTDVRARKLKVRPLCSFVADWFDRHPENADLLA